MSRPPKITPHWGQATEHESLWGTILDSHKTVTRGWQPGPFTSLGKWLPFGLTEQW